MYSVHALSPVLLFPVFPLVWQFALCIPLLDPGYAWRRHTKIQQGQAQIITSRWQALRQPPASHIIEGRGAPRDPNPHRIPSRAYVSPTFLCQRSLSGCLLLFVTVNVDQGELLGPGSWIPIREQQGHQGMHPRAPVPVGGSWPRLSLRSACKPNTARTYTFHIGCGDVFGLLETEHRTV